MAVRTVFLFLVACIGQRLRESESVAVSLSEERVRWPTSLEESDGVPTRRYNGSSSASSERVRKWQSPLIPEAEMRATQGGGVQRVERESGIPDLLMNTSRRESGVLKHPEASVKSHLPEYQTSLTSVVSSNMSANEDEAVSINLDSSLGDLARLPEPRSEAGAAAPPRRTPGRFKRVAAPGDGQARPSGLHLLQGEPGPAPSGTGPGPGTPPGPGARRRRSWLWNQFFVIEEYRGPEPVLIGRLHTDMDGGDGRTRYTLEGEGVGSVFVIDGSTGNIHVTKSLDREEKDQYRLVATAKDRQTGRALEPSSEFIIRVQDINDNPPVFPDEPYAATVPEMANIGTSIIQVTACDADDPTYGNSARLVYAITHGQDYFSVDPQTGVLRTAVADMDREAQEQYLVVLQAKDMGGHLGGLSGTTTVTVSLSDVNDNPPHFRRSAWTFSVSELAAPGVEVGRLTASDPDLGDNALLEFSIQDTDHMGNTFNITAKDREAVIMLNKLLDYESRSSYAFSVEVSNPLVDARYLRKGPFKDLAGVRVLVLNADEPPRFSRTRYRLDVSENCPSVCSVGLVSAVDPDTGESTNIRYSIDPQSDPEAFFRIGSDTGFISTVMELDREQEQWHNITVIATQRDNPNLVTRVVVAIETLDQNDNAPELDRQYVTSVCDSSAPGQVVQVLHAVDRDQGGSDTPVHFSIPPESSSSLNLSIRESEGVTASLVVKSTLEPVPGFSSSLLTLYVPVVLRDVASGLTNTGTVTVTVCPCLRGGMRTEERGRTRERKWERHAVCRPLPSPSTSLIFSMVTLLTLLACITTLLVVCALSMSLRHHKPDAHSVLEEEDVRENIISYDDEGGGEADTAAFDITALQSMQSNPNIWYTQQNMPRVRTYSWSRNPRPGISATRPGSAPLYGRLCYGRHTLPVLRDYPQGPLEAGLQLAQLNYGLPGSAIGGSLGIRNQGHLEPAMDAAADVMAHLAEVGVACAKAGGTGGILASGTATGTCGGGEVGSETQPIEDQMKPADTGAMLTNSAPSPTSLDPRVEPPSRSHSGSPSSGAPGSTRTQASPTATSSTVDDVDTDPAVPSASERNCSRGDAPVCPTGGTYSVVGSVNPSKAMQMKGSGGGDDFYQGRARLLNMYSLGRREPSPLNVPGRGGVDTGWRRGAERAPGQTGTAASLPLRMEDFLNFRLDRVTFDLSQPPYDSLQTYEFEGRDSPAESLSSLESDEGREEGGGAAGGMEALNQKFRRLVEIIREREREMEQESEVREEGEGKAREKEAATTEEWNAEAVVMDTNKQGTHKDTEEEQRWDF